MSSRTSSRSAWQADWGRRNDSRGRTGRKQTDSATNERSCLGRTGKAGRRGEGGLALETTGRPLRNARRRQYGGGSRARFSCLGARACDSLTSRRPARPLYTARDWEPTPRRRERTGRIQKEPTGGKNCLNSATRQLRRAKWPGSASARRLYAGGWGVRRGGRATNKCLRSELRDTGALRRGRKSAKEANNQQRGESQPPEKRWEEYRRGWRRGSGWGICNTGRRWEGGSECGTRGHARLSERRATKWRPKKTGGTGHCSRKT